MRSKVIKKPDFSSITEVPGLRASQEQLMRLYHRYRFALDYAAAKDVVEVACGSGIGLGFLAGRAKTVIGGDIDKNNIARARNTYKGTSVHIEEMDAHQLPLKDGAVDLLILFEAIYYLEHPTTFIREARRVLRDKGTLIICTVNRDWEDFHPSPYALEYFSVPALYQLLKNHFSTVECFGAFSTQKHGLVAKGISFVKRRAVQFGLIPGSLTARAYLKRFFIGPLKAIPAQIYNDMATYTPPLPVSMNKVNDDYKIIYAVAVK